MDVKIEAKVRQIVNKHVSVNKIKSDMEFFIHQHLLGLRNIFDKMADQLKLAGVQHANKLLETVTAPEHTELFYEITKIKAELQLINN